MIRGLLAGVLLLGLVSAPAAAHAAHKKKASPALSLSSSSVAVSESRIAKITVRCRSSKTCRGTLRLRVAAKSSAGRSYAVRSKKAKTYSVRLTPAQLAAIPRGGKKTSSLRIFEKRPKRIKGRSVRLVLSRAAAPRPAPAPATPSPTGPTGPEESRAYSEKNWTPTAGDTCPASLHRSHSVVGPDGKLYPTWHPPTDVDPATGRSCTYGHEHGDDPSASDIYEWVTDFLDADAASSRGIPFGYVSEALDTYASEHDHVTRHEDNVGHKIIVANDVSMVAAEPRGYVRDDEGKIVTCDFLMKVHQGTHSGDALINNAHELLYAARCTDGTELISSTLTRFGDANQFERSCDLARVETSGSDLPDGFGGRRIIPDRFCVDRDVLVPSGETSKLWALYEVWESVNKIETADGAVIASFDPWFGVRNPSRAHAGGMFSTIFDLIDTLWMIDPDDEGTAKGGAWSAHSGEHLAKTDPQSPFDGAQRDFYLRSTTVDNATGLSQWWTDPYGDNAVTTASPGLVRQWVAAGDNTWWPELERRSFNLEKDYGKDNGVHAPN